MNTKSVNCETLQPQLAKGRSKTRITDLSKHRYFREPWALTYAGGADFEDRQPRVTGAIPEFLGVNRIAVSREVRVLLRYI
ncbi:MAG: hypothetical protein K2X47_06810, partial [Bdellovibrionales bacterium]|nr:hypothetical protein [Bdellovibrionales bacterium]